MGYLVSHRPLLRAPLRVSIREVHELLDGLTVDMATMVPGHAQQAQIGDQRCQAFERILGDRARGRFCEQTASENVEGEGGSRARDTQHHLILQPLNRLNPKP